MNTPLYKDSTLESSLEQKWGRHTSTRSYLDRENRSQRIQPVESETIENHHKERYPHFRPPAPFSVPNAPPFFFSPPPSLSFSRPPPPLLSFSLPPPLSSSLRRCQMQYYIQLALCWACWKYGGDLPFHVGRKRRLLRYVNSHKPMLPSWQKRNIL